ncbi:MAG: efflux RND transporter periplasmic adaptor subunit [Gammaproteobacteria bacterium]|nr:efflux RND transporter periplasmic adaptor subunit [Gammaproteobacteria bacterium]MCW5582985.1 efflux RND transporter periplasmic adaptor subunit [Gammaproteobacteria bacterium]
MKKKIILVTLIGITAITWGIYKYRSQAAVQEPNAIWVQAINVEESTLPLDVNAIGTLVARSVEITPELAGHVRKILFQDGTFVKKDTFLIQLDDAVYKAKYESSKAQLVYSKNDYKRKSLLGKQGAVTQQAIDQADADLKEKMANAQESAVMVNKMKLIAPFSGMVGKSKVNPGDYVTTGQSLVTLTDTLHLRIEYNVPEQYLPLLKLGQEVKVTSATYPGKIFYGKVSFISPTINSENRSVSLYADVPNENNILAAGMFVNVQQSLGTEEHVLMIPARSLVPILDGEQVYKVADGKAYSVTVLTGKRSGEKVQVLQGLSRGDVVITDGQLKVKNGMRIKIKS